MEQEQTHSIILITPFWKTQPCYLWRLKTSLLLPKVILLSIPKTKTIHLMWREIQPQLQRFTYQEKTCFTVAFQKTLKSLYSNHGEYLHKPNIKQFWKNSTNSHCVKSVQIRCYFWSVFSGIWTEYRKIRTRNNSVFGHFSRSVYTEESFNPFQLTLTFLNKD